ncbi:MAG: methyltransferase, partial [Rubrivivax sp.]|nr:methyltransferase [Rubrivivax sp.]
MADTDPQIHWTDDDGRPQQARWRSLAGHPAPAHVVLVDERTRADVAYRLACEGSALLWRGDYRGARQLLLALTRRIERPAPRSAKPAQSLTEAFHLHRQRQAQRARILGQLLLPFDADHGVALPSAPDLRAAGRQARGEVTEHYVATLRELLGLIGAHEWRKKGVVIAALGAAIHPHHGVFSPVRGEYVGLVAQAPLPAAAASAGAFDIGTGTGVLAALLARRGLRVTATDLSP